MCINMYTIPCILSVGVNPLHQTMYVVCRRQPYTSYHVCCLSASTMNSIPDLLAMSAHMHVYQTMSAVCQRQRWTPDLLSMSAYRHVHHTMYAVCRRQRWTPDLLSMSAYKHVHQTRSTV